MTILLTPDEELTQQTYARYAVEYGKKQTPVFWRNEVRQMAASLRPLADCRHVLDVGCGTGRDAPLFLHEGCDYTGIDLSPEMLALARVKTPGADFREMSMYTLDFPSDHFDAFWAVASLLHIPKYRVPLVFRELIRVVRHGGQGFIVMLEGCGEAVLKGRSGDHDRFFARYMPTEFMGYLLESGLVLKKYTRDSNRQRGITWLLYWVEVKK